MCFPLRGFFAVLLRCGGEIVKSMFWIGAPSWSSEERSITLCFALVLFLFRVMVSGEATDPVRWLPFKFFCVRLVFNSLYNSLVFCSCFLVIFSKLEIRRLEASC